MISENEAKTQIGRVAHLGGFPRSQKAAIDDLVKALANNSRDLAHADTIISDWIYSPRVDHNEAPQAPTVADICTMARGGKIADWTGKRNCELCGDSGFVRGEPRIVEGFRYDVAKRCSCMGVKA